MRITPIKKYKLEEDFEKLLFKYFEIKNSFGKTIYLFHSKENYCIRYNDEKDNVEIRRPFDTDFDTLYFYVPEEKLNELYEEMLETIEIMVKQKC